MKRVTWIAAAVVALGCMLWACKDSFLVSKPQSGIYTDLNVFKTKSDFDLYVFGAYAELQGSGTGGGGRNFVVIPGFISQDILAVDEKAKVLGSFLTPGTGDQGIWTPCYKVAGRANLLLDKLTAAQADLTATEKTAVEAESKFLRGLAYFMLARAYGSIPMPLAPYEPAQNSLECTPEAQVWDQVIKDLTDAAAKLPQRAGWSANNVGRATKGSALSFLVNAYMYKKEWANAAKASQDVMALGEYKLLPDVRSLYSLKNENNEESLFELQYRSVENGNFVWGGQPNNGNVLGEETAPRSIGDKYAPFGGWGEVIMNKKLADSFEKGDQRRSKLVVAVGETYKGENMTEAVTISSTIAQNNSAFSTKYWLGPNKVYLNGHNIYMMRYAEFLLNTAEIQFELGKTAEAYTALNAVRQRSGLPAKPAQADKEVFLTALMNERRWELNFEPNLWWHYTRTGRAKAFLETEYGLTFNPAWNKLPIPQGDRDQNPKLCQNPGY